MVPARAAFVLQFINDVGKLLKVRIDCAYFTYFIVRNGVLRFRRDGARRETPRRRASREIAPEDQYKVQARGVNLTTLPQPAWASDVNNNNMYYSLHLGRHWEVNTNAEIRLNSMAP